MPNKTLIEQLNSAWICQHFADVTDNDKAWVLKCGVMFIVSI